MGNLRQKCGRNTLEIHFSRLERSFQCDRQGGKSFASKQVHIHIQESVCHCPSPPCVLLSQECYWFMQLRFGCRNIWKLTWCPGVSLQFPLPPASCVVYHVLFLSDPRGVKLYFPMVHRILYVSVG